MTRKLHEHPRALDPNKTTHRERGNHQTPTEQPRGEATSTVVRTSTTTDHERGDYEGGGEERTAAAQTSPSSSSSSSSSSAPPHLPASLPPPRATVRRQPKPGPTAELRSHLNQSPAVLLVRPRHAARASRVAVVRLRSARREKIRGRRPDPVNELGRAGVGSRARAHNAKPATSKASSER